MARALLISVIFSTLCCFSAYSQDSTLRDSIRIYSIAGRGKLYIRLLAEKEEKVALQIVDMNGKIRLQKSVTLNVGTNLATINIRSLPNGIYVVVIIKRSGMFTGKFEVGPTLDNADDVQLFSASGFYPCALATQRVAERASPTLNFICMMPII